MNRKEAAELLPIIQAFAEGRKIERKTRSWEFNKGWRDETQWEETEELICRDTFVYRIKPEPKYRPFKNAEECWQEMQKHQPFGWVIGKCEKKILITEVLTFGINLHRQESPYVFEEANRILTFSDGVPFGVKVEE